MNSAAIIWAAIGAICWVIGTIAEKKENGE